MRKNDVLKGAELDQYLMKNHQLLTTTELAEKTGRSYANILKKCQALGIVPVTNAEKIEKTIRENLEATFDQMMILTDLSSVALKRHLEILKITLKKEVKVRLTDKEKEIQKRKKEEESIKVREKVIQKAKRKLDDSNILGPIARQYSNTMSLLEASNKLRHGE